MQKKKKLEDHMVKFINIEITLRHCFSPVNLLHIFRTRFLKNTSGWLLLNNVSDICSSHVSHVIHSKLSRFAYFQENGNSVSRKYSNCFEQYSSTVIMHHMCHLSTKMRQEFLKNCNFSSDQEFDFKVIVEEYNFPLQTIKEPLD